VGTKYHGWVSGTIIDGLYTRVRPGLDIRMFGNLQQSSIQQVLRYSRPPLIPEKWGGFNEVNLDPRVCQIQCCLDSSPTASDDECCFVQKGNSYYGLCALFLQYKNDRGYHIIPSDNI
jgi:hypothetical protein